jgi:hypothetical protein
MTKRMTDDEIMDFTYNKLFGDLDNIQSGELFDDKDDLHGTAENAEPASKESGGMKITIEPLMVAAREGGKDPQDDGKDRGLNIDEVEDEDEDKFKGISKMSPLMAQMHGSR